MKQLNLRGLVAATHTPFHADGSLNLGLVESQAQHLIRQGIATAFIGGSTGESHSLNFEERRQLARRWLEITRGTNLRVIVHVGSNCLDDAAALARQAQELGALAIAALAPSYFKPANVAGLIECCANIADAAPETPFYFYDIPSLTGVNLPMLPFLLEARERIPTLAGLKYTNPDLIVLQECLHLAGEFADILWGTDECLLPAFTLGVKGAVGSTYNFAAPIARRVLTALAAGDLDQARTAQYQIVQLVRTLAGYGYLGAAKAVMTMLGVDVGPARLPLRSLSEEEAANLRRQLEALGFFDWITATQPQPLNV